MSCTDREKQLPAYLGGGLSSAEMDELMDHLASCATCRKTLEDLKKTGRLVCDLEKISPPLRLKSQIMNRAREGAEKKGFLRKFFFPLYIKIPVQVLAVAVLSVFSFYLYRQDVPRMRTEEIPLPPSPVFETNREPPLPRVISRKRSAMPKNAVQADQEMPAASAGRSDAGDSVSSMASEEKVPETGKIAADERTAENVPASAAPLPPVMPQVSGREAKDVFLSAENQKNGGNERFYAVSNGEKQDLRAGCGTVPIRGRGRKGRTVSGQRGLDAGRGNIPGMGSVGSRCEDGVGGIGGLCRKNRFTACRNGCPRWKTRVHHRHQALSCRSFPGKTAHPRSSECGSGARNCQRGTLGPHQDHPCSAGLG